jgi:hypothetical protein
MAAVHSVAIFLRRAAAGMIGLRRRRLMAYSQQDIDSLRSALSSGQLIVRSGDRSVQYRSLDEMRQQLRIMESDVAGATPGLVLGRHKAIFARD